MSAARKSPGLRWLTAITSAKPSRTTTAALSSAAVTSPVYQVRIFGITTNPAPVSSSNGSDVLPDARLNDVVTYLKYLHQHAGELEG